jgi:hypothetical protein
MDEKREASVSNLGAGQGRLMGQTFTAILLEITASVANSIIDT